MVIEGAEELTVVRIPNFGSVVSAGGDNNPTVGAEGGYRKPFSVVVEGVEKFQDGTYDLVFCRYFHKFKNHVLSLKVSLLNEFYAFRKREFFMYNRAALKLMLYDLCHFFFEGKTSAIKSSEL